MSWLNKMWNRVWYNGNMPTKFYQEYNHIKIYFQSDKFYEKVYFIRGMIRNIFEYILMSTFVLGVLLLFGYEFTTKNFFSAFSLLVLVNEVPNFIKRCKK